ncbi:hypothetical protein OG204_07630 [Streptomyces sp. NBC_01387]|uniref:hypothetical protein n=1 Tax=unclassified Streptomyces TaxID=2593676 RepID=UPI0020252AA5|nr:MULTISPECIES: hypothetical protein [unclassified Streptomyces]MCX4551844.1 hypothetical protein [Streptomyces sp. NBC_01500]WSC23208.1 hypothetical protein OIE60_27990 [Streptomyces sp. NBC_01766]WSV57119.1 hypothetical protein OG282_27410 [Streptomyces sp. NBC_01014]
MAIRLPRSPSGWTMAVFGVLAAVLGVAGLVSPDALLKMLGFHSVPVSRRPGSDYTRTFITASSMAAVNMGVYYVLAALADWKAFFRWTVPFRLLTFAVFTTAVVTGRAPAGFLGVGLWEGTGAVVTGLALRYEKAGAARPVPAPTG